MAWLSLLGFAPLYASLRINECRDTNWRKIMRKLLGIFGLLTVLLVPAGVAVAQMEMKEGTDYKVVGQARSESPKVIEFYAYGCPHCRTLEPQIKRWAEANADGAEVIRVPVTFGRPQWRRFTEAYYVGEVLNLREPVHAALFELAHEGGNLDSEAAFVAFFAKQGVEAQQVLSTLKSFAVQSRLKQGESLARQYKVMGIPSFIVNDKYQTDAAMLGSLDKLDGALTSLLNRPD